MTKAMRWGVSSLMIVGGIALGAFAGCSDDDTKTEPTADSGAPTDTGSTDTGSTPTDTGVTDTGSTPTDTGPTDTGTTFVPDRAVTLLFGAPDLSPKFVCLGAFSPASDPTTLDAPASSQPSAGALGVPDSAAPTDPTKTTAFPYGAVVPVPLNADAIAALKVFKVVVYLVDENPAKIGSTCAAEWKKVKGDPKRYQIFSPNAVKTGEHALVSMIGCQNPPGDMTGTCTSATGNFEFRLDILDTAKPATGNMGIQFFHLSQFPGGGGAPSWSPVDAYLMPMPSSTASTDAGLADTSGSDAGTPAPTFIKIAENVSYKSLTAKATGIDLPSWASPADSYIVLAPRLGGAAGKVCATADGKPSADCPNYTLPLKPFVAAYAPVGGGLTTSTNQLIGLIGSGVAPTVDGGPGIPSLRIPMVKVSPLPTKTW